MSGNSVDSWLDGDRTPSPDVAWEDNLTAFLRSFRKANLSRNSISFSEFNDQWEYEDWITCLLGEIGEAIDARKKIKRSESVKANEDRLVEQRLELAREIADAWTYLDIALAKAGHPSPEFDAVCMEKVRRTLAGAGSFQGWLLVAGLACSMTKYSISYSPAAIPVLASNVFHLLLALCEEDGLDFRSVLTEKFNLVSDRVGSEIKL